MPLAYDEPTLMIPNISEHAEDCEGSVSSSSTIKAIAFGRRTAERLPYANVAMKLKAAGFIFSA
jgi:hypothetical protein